jgi:hypothetical protein
MVDTIFFASNQSSLKFLPAFGTVYHDLLQHLDFYLNHGTLFPTQVLGGIHENFISASSCALYIYMCVHIFWLISFYLWLVLVFLFSRVSYGFTALQHYMSQHYTSQHSHGSLSLSFVMKVMVCHFVNNSHEVMTALIVVLPLIVVVEISLQLHQSLLLSFMWICWYCLKNYWQRNKWQCKKWE